MIEHGMFGVQLLLRHFLDFVSKELVIATPKKIEK